MNAGIYREYVPLVDIVKGRPNADGEMIVPKATKTGGKPTRDLSKDQQELVDIIDKLEMRKQDFAAHLGIGLPRLSSYIYGQTVSVPPAVMNKARLLYAEQGPSLAAVKQQFDKPMSEFIDEWAERLGTNTQEKLAKLLGVTTMTIHRWRIGEVRPDLTALVRYTGQVAHLEEIMRIARDEAVKLQRA